MNYDTEIQAIADYVLQFQTPSQLAWQTAKACLLDSLGCAIAASHNPHCQHLLGVSFPTQASDCPIPGTSLRLPLIQAAWNIGLLIRWLDYNDTWLAAEWGHPSDNLGAILAAAYQMPNATLADVMLAMIKAYEIQGVLALENSFNQRGFDHVILVKLASTAVATHILGGNREQICAAISHAFLDGHPLRTYRHAPNTGPRKSWASGDACARALQLATWSLAGESGYPQVLTAPKWGFQDVILQGEALQRDREYADYVMENILFKVAFPAEFHGQTAVECAIALHEQVKDRLDDISAIEVRTQRAAMDIINKSGKLNNVADRDHALQYMIAIGLLKGNLVAADYEDAAAADPRIDDFRAKMVLREDEDFTEAYYDPQRRAIANAIRLQFKNDDQTEWQTQYYPLGHRRRRAEALPLLQAKCQHNIASVLSKQNQATIQQWWQCDVATMKQLSVSEFMQIWHK